MRPNARIGSAMMSSTRQRGLRLANGSWKIICRRRRSFWRSASCAGAHMSMPSKVTLPDVGGNSPTTILATVDLPDPDSPTRARVSPALDRERDARYRLEIGLVRTLDQAIEPRPGDVEHAAEALRLDKRRLRSCGISRHLIGDQPAGSLRRASRHALRPFGAAARRRRARSAGGRHIPQVWR